MEQFQIVKLVTKFNSLGVVHLNRYYYRQISAGTVGLDDVVNAWLAQVGAELQTVLSGNTAMVEIEAINLNDLADFYTTDVIGWTGAIAGDTMPPFTTWYYKYERASREFRPGRKSFGLLAEGSVVDGVAIGSILPDLNTLATALEDNLTTPVAGGTLSPVLAREAIGVGVLAWTGVTGVSYQAVSTQNTRKFGRGI